jgi:hypothetical protein
VPSPKTSFIVAVLGLALALGGTVAFLSPDVPIALSMGLILAGWAVAIVGAGVGITGLVRTWRTRSQNPPAGWYPDPQSGSGQRYWDGNAWTSHTA